jgi:hypothetical protein
MPQEELDLYRAQLDVFDEVELMLPRNRMLDRLWHEVERLRKDNAMWRARLEDTLGYPPVPHSQYTGGVTLPAPPAAEEGEDR